MNPQLLAAWIAGVERVAAWADLLDRINVFPVADGDTGRNLLLTLGPLLHPTAAQATPAQLAEQLLLAARGNSGNLAARFLSGWLTAAPPGGPDWLSLAAAVSRGNELAWQAVPLPREGTMLSFFRELVAALAMEDPLTPTGLPRVIDRLTAAVRQTTEQLPKLRAAGVVDAGALGMFLFCDGLFCHLAGQPDAVRAVVPTFGDRLRLADDWRPGAVHAGEAEDADAEEHGAGACCIDAVLRVGEQGDTSAQLAALGESVVTLQEGELLKVHLHAADQAQARAGLSRLGQVVAWAADDLAAQLREFQPAAPPAEVHLMTDAAGSVTRADAAALGMTLLDSYINLERRSVAETCLDPAELYRAMRAGVAVSTSQASEVERHQHYRKVLELFPRVVYLCVGSVFTGNHRVVTSWQRQHDPGGRLLVVDSGSASGRLGVAALVLARLARTESDPTRVRHWAVRAANQAQELVFLEQLRYLAAGGRLSHTAAFFGDTLRMKPVITPAPDGARKVGVVHSRKGQLNLAVRQLGQTLGTGQGWLVLLQHTDNEEWLRTTVLPELTRRHPEAEFLVRPCSLTSGAHMGPGTWGVAWLDPRAVVADRGSPSV